MASPSRSSCPNIGRSIRSAAGASGPDPHRPERGAPAAREAHDVFGDHGDARRGDLADTRRTSLAPQAEEGFAPLTDDVVVAERRAGRRRVVGGADVRRVVASVDPLGREVESQECGTQQVQRARMEQKRARLHRRRPARRGKPRRAR